LAARPGDLLSFMDAGAYGFAMASNYNARPRPAEVLIQDCAFRLIRARERTAELLANEQNLLISE